MITVNWSCDMEQGHEDTMMGSHPGGRVTACSVRCSIFEYLMAMMAGDLTLGREGTALASDLLTEKLESLFGRTNYRPGIAFFWVEKPRVISDRSVGVLWLLV
ncbi:hypothetical protein IGI04_026041 [Brassica rapa subsp. trilocularis]|uniref:Uncharacterized protein n=1 Tax=Brassica rapa subsp. trilocularis TaxID=1813537 RepID=A0ABQ7KV60_BRACM|nr:hypothetical protein IGI04_026041 [Brassica rapa subsp. trilocularis]